MMAIAEGNSNDALMAFSRPIERLPIRKTSAVDHKEAMNCKSCRKRKVKCNRLKPSCEACQVFNCPCVYDAIPKKRGPKTDVLEALLKRVNGLEKRLKDEQKPVSPENAESPSSPKRGSAGSESSPIEAATQSPPKPRPAHPEVRPARATSVPIEPVPPANDAIAFTDALLDTYFARVHNKPYYILDETATRQRLRDGRLPPLLINAIHAVSIRYVPHLCGGHSGAIRSSHEYVLRSRADIDADEPCIDNLQALLLLAMANFQNGKGKRCYMALTHAISIAFALALHRELSTELRITNSERESRRKLFWTCYLMDRFTVSGSKRPSLISDESIHLRLPGWQPPGSQTWIEGNFFPNGSSLPCASGVSNASLGSGTMLVEITRVLGVTNRYLGAGGAKGDSHFPWHAQSMLSRIRSDLDYWAAATREIFTSIDTLFGSPDSSTLVLSKLIYHLIHCLIYRPFLPIDLNELCGAGQNQSWQIEATKLCFLNANAIAELVEIGRNTALLDWPSFVGYCICTAGTVHIHGAHYMSYRDGDAFCHSAEFLARETAQLLELRIIWAGVQHQRDTLQVVYASHAQLVKSLASNPMRISPVFQMEDFFDRYPGSYIDGAHATFTDIVLDTSFESVPVFDGIQEQNEVWNDQFVPEVTFAPMVPSQQVQNEYGSKVVRKSKRRRSTTSALPYPTPKMGSMSSVPSTTVEEQTQDHRPPEVHSNGNQGVVEEHGFNPMLFQGTSTPNFTFSPVQSALTMKNHTRVQDMFQQHAAQFDHGAPSAVHGNQEHVQMEGQNDPFLSLLEHMAENDSSGLEGRAEFDFFAGGEM